MSSRPGSYNSSDNLPPSYTVTAGPEYPPHAPPPIAAPVPKAKAQYAYGFAPNANAKDGGAQVDVDVRQLTRTPSPTPSEQYVLTHKSRSCDLRKTFDFKGNPRQILSGALAVAVIVFLVLFLVYQRRIEEWLRPFADWMHDTPGGWLIPIAIMFVLSFPPLFGHEIIAVLCGVVWGVWVGFGIVAAGTVVGELGSFLAFKHWCKARGKRTEETNLKYALLAQVVRDGGFKIPVVMRLSMIPGHLLTAIFSTLGMSLLTFLGVAVLGLPKQLAVVYVGVSSSDADGAKKAKIVKGVVIALTGLVTYASMRYIYRKMDEAKGGVVYRRRKARQAKMLAAAAGCSADGTPPKALGLGLGLDADLERAAGDLGAIHLDDVPSATHAASAHAHRRPPGVTDSNRSATALNPFGSERERERDTVAS